MCLTSVSTVSLTNHKVQMVKYALQDLGFFEQGPLLWGLLKNWQHIFHSLLLYQFVICCYCSGLVWLLGHHPHADQLRLIFQHFHPSFSFTVLSAVSVKFVFINNILKWGSRGIVKNIIWKFEGCRKIKCTFWKTYLGCGCIKVSGGFLSLSWP